MLDHQVYSGYATAKFDKSHLKAHVMLTTRIVSGGSATPSSLRWTSVLGRKGATAEDRIDHDHGWVHCMSHFISAAEGGSDWNVSCKYCLNYGGCVHGMRTASRPSLD